MQDEQLVTEDEAMESLERANPMEADADPHGSRGARIYEAARGDSRSSKGVFTGRVTAMAGGLAAVTAIVVAGVFAFGGGNGSGGGSVPAAPTSDPNAVSVDVDGGLATMCAFEYTLETLLERDFAFDGTVVEVGVQPAPTAQPPAETMPEAEGVTFQVHEWFRGPGGETITLQGSGLPIGYGSVTDESATLNVGDRYLVSGSDVFVWTCGFTKTYSDNTANEWRGAFTN